MLLQHEDAKTLVRFCPEFDPDESEKREMFLTPQLGSWLYEADQKHSRNFKANIRAFLGRFVKGMPIDNCDYMKSWDRNIWELRVQIQPRSERIRIFGGFVKADTFVGTYYKWRKDFGDKEDPAWAKALDRVESDLRGLFGRVLLIPARPFSNCVTADGYDCRGG